MSPQRPSGSGRKPGGRGKKSPGARSEAGPGSRSKGRGRGGTKGRRGRGRARDANEARLKPLTESTTLDLNQARDLPLTDKEREEAEGHLTFLRRFKGALRLSFNAKEDLLVTGAKPPSDRGVLKHLFTKVDKGAVDRALAREPLKSDARQRTAFLAGVVRLNPDPSALLHYLETLSEASDRRLAAQAFGATTRRLDFSSVSAAQFTRLLEVCRGTFEGADRVQALFGLLDSTTFRAALDKHGQALAPPLADDLLPLAAAHRAVSQDAPLPTDDGERALISRGVTRWMQAPAQVLVSYPLEHRLRLAQFVVVASDGTAPDALPPALMDSVPRDHEGYLKLGLQWSEKLLKAGQVEAAAGLLKQVCQAHPEHRDAARRRDALAGERFGPLVLTERSQGAFRAGFWPAEAAHGWAWISSPEGAQAATNRARWQAELAVPGLAPLLSHGRGPGARCFVFVAARGRPLTPSRRGLREALRTTRQVVGLLRGLAAVGVELPNVRPDCFWFDPRGDGLQLVDLSEAERTDPTRAAMTMAPVVLRVARALLWDENQDGLRADLPADLAQVLSGRAPLPVLTKALALACAR